jgi:hypothetical protein
MGFEDVVRGVFAGHFSALFALRSGRQALKMAPMSFKKLIEFCGEELQWSWRAIVALYEALRELDEMTIAALMTYLREL